MAFFIVTTMKTSNLTCEFFFSIILITVTLGTKTAAFMVLCLKFWEIVFTTNYVANALMIIVLIVAAVMVVIMVL
jgi:hypothetical protein